MSAQDYAGLWTVGVFNDGEIVTFGPLSRQGAEELFARLNRDLDDDSTAFIQPLRPWRDGTWRLP